MTILEPVRQFIAELTGRRFGLAQAIKAVNRPRRPVLRMLDNLTKEGYLKQIKDAPVAPGQGESGRFRRNPTWEINKTMSVLDRPRVKKRPRTLRDKMWTIIRARRRFTRSQLVVLASCSRGSTEDYTLLLERNGYIRRIGKESNEILWLLVKNDSPMRPRIKEDKS